MMRITDTILQISFQLNFRGLKEKNSTQTLIDKTKNVAVGFIDSK
ncbi:MAG: hypothetical protein WDN26_20080 [Chitinophagaceae bacterium]